MQNKKIDEQALKSIEVEVLKGFHRFCEEHKLRYMLAYGTLLGAVRHKGFIPWDDDIDVMMPRPDYERFLELAMQGFGGHWKAICHKNEKRYPYPFAKVIDTRTVLHESLIDSTLPLGVYIDIFPLDGTPSEQEAFQKFCQRVKKNWLLVQMASMKIQKGKSFLRTMVKYLTVPICHAVGPRYFINRTEGYLGQYPYAQNEFVAVAALDDVKQTRSPKGLFEDLFLLPFEDGMFYAPRAYDAMLTQTYGDYMQLPPEEQRVTHHVFEAYWKADAREEN